MTGRARSADSIKFRGGLSQTMHHFAMLRCRPAQRPWVQAHTRCGVCQTQIYTNHCFTVLRNVLYDEHFYLPGFHVLVVVLVRCIRRVPDLGFLSPWLKTECTADLRLNAIQRPVRHSSPTLSTATHSLSLSLCVSLSLSLSIYIYMYRWYIYICMYVHTALQQPRCWRTMTDALKH